MADVFISYAREDHERARLLASALEACGWSVWWDRRIIAGQTFDQVIERELEAAKSVVVLWSTHSVTSEWVKNEAAVAAERGVLVPVFLDPVKLPLEFRRRQTADLVGWDGEATHEGFQSLRDALAATITGTVPPRPTPVPLPCVRRRRWRTVPVLVALIVVLALGVYWFVSQGDQRITKVSPGQARSPDELVQRLSELQQKEVELLGQGQREQATALIERNVRAVDNALQQFPDNAQLHTLRGYAFKDKYLSSKGVPVDQRREYLAEARRSFSQALHLDPDNAGAHNGLGNVLFFLGHFDAAIEQHDLALRLTRGNYPAAEHDKRLVEQVRDGTIPFDF